MFKIKKNVNNAITPVQNVQVVNKQIVQFVTDLLTEFMTHPLDNVTVFLNIMMMEMNFVMSVIILVQNVIKEIKQINALLVTLHLIDLLYPQP